MSDIENQLYGIVQDAMKNLSTDNLESCPYCGGKTVVIVRPDGSRAEAWVECSRCQASGSHLWTDYTGGNKGEIIALVRGIWNERVQIMGDNTTSHFRYIENVLRVIRKLEGTVFSITKKKDYDSFCREQFDDLIQTVRSPRR